ncbi:MAG: S41 family peptidase, partial [Christensenellales bacterium]
YKVTKNALDVYNNQKIVCTINGYFLDELEVPYVSIEDVCENSREKVEGGFSVPDYTFSYVGGVLEAKKPYKTELVSIFFDTENDTIYSDSYWEAVDLYDIGQPSDMLGPDNSPIVQIIDRDYRQDKRVVLDLGKYNIDLITYKGKVLIPFPVLNPLFFWQEYNVYTYSNGAIYSSNDINRIGSFSYNAYVSIPEEKKNAKRNRTTAEFNADFFCFEMDYFYGNKDISSFRDCKSFMEGIGQYDNFSSPEPLKCYDALAKIIYAIDDIHSSPKIPSVSCGNVYGSSDKDVKAFEAYAETWNYFGNRCSNYKYVAEKNRDLRSAVLGDEAETGFYYHGDVLYIRFDSFARSNNSKVFAENGNGIISLQPVAYDRNSFNLFYDAFNDLRSNHPEVKNILIDLSVNHGGDTTTLTELLGFFMEEVNIGIYNSVTDNYYLMSYRVDTNMDGVYDGKDFQAKDYNVFCLTSGASFSCANIFSAILQDEKAAVIIGENTGGGNCIIMNSVTATGDFYNKSAPFAYARKAENGGLLHNDSGVSVDKFLLQDNYYDTDILWSVINSLTE